jgi:hypothetical protein
MIAGLGRGALVALAAIAVASTLGPVAAAHAEDAAHATRSSTPTATPPSTARWGWGWRPHARGAPEEHSIGLVDGFHVRDFVRAMPSARALPSLLENVLQPAILGLDESGGSSRVDPERVSIYGDTWTRTAWLVDGLDVSDPLFTGAAAVHVPAGLWGGVAVLPAEARGAPGAVEVTLRAPEEAAELTAGVTLPDVGGIVPFGVPLLDAVSGLHALQRTIPPPDERRRFRSQVLAEASGRVTFGGTPLTYGVALADATRRWLRLDPVSGALAGVVDEPTTQASLALARGPWRVLGELRRRGNLYLELGHAPSESAKLDSAALVVGYTGPRARVGLTLRHATIGAVAPGAPRELMDPDAEVSTPDFPSGRYLLARATADVEGDGWFVRAHQTFGAFAALLDAWSTPLTLRGVGVGVVEQTSRDVGFGHGELRAGLRAHAALGGWRLSGEVQGFVGDMVAGAQPTLLLGAGGRVAAERALTERWDLELVASRTPLGPTARDTLMATPGWLERRVSFGGEGLVSTTGGTFVDVPAALRAPTISTLGLTLAWRFGDAWRLRAQGLLRRTDDTLGLAFDARSASSTGRFGDDGAFFLAPGEKRYVLRNGPFGDGWYYGGQLQVVGHVESRWIFALSFAVFNVIGRPAPGNGSEANDLGVVSWDMASPTARRYGLASLDADRAFLTKLTVGGRLFDTLTALVTIKHKDGQPFAFSVPVESRGQVVMVPWSNRGSPLKYDRPFIGPREDFRLSLDAEVRWPFDLDGVVLEPFVLGTNLLDVGSELRELNTPVGIRTRSAVELETPRALMVGLTIR